LGRKKKKKMARRAPDARSNENLKKNGGKKIIQMLHKYRRTLCLRPPPGSAPFNAQMESVVMALDASLLFNI
jgi:hypothetical protein